jgi:hypothetical protein
VVPLDENGQPTSVLHTGQDLEVEVHIEGLTGFADANVALVIYDPIGYRLVDVNTALQGQVSQSRAPKSHGSVPPAPPSVEARAYLAGLWLGQGSVEDIDGITYFTNCK